MIPPEEKFNIGQEECIHCPRWGVSTKTGICKYCGTKNYEKPPLDPFGNVAVNFNRRPPKPPKEKKIRQTKLTPEQVKEMREIYAKEKITYRALAAKYGVSGQLVWSIIKGRWWKGV